MTIVIYVYETVGNYVIRSDDRELATKNSIGSVLAAIDAAETEVKLKIEQAGIVKPHRRTK